MTFPEFKKVTIVSDFIAKSVADIDGMVVQSFSGGTVAEIGYKVDEKKAKLDKFDYVLFMWEQTMLTINARLMLSFQTLETL